jgi:hypothetical protein
VNRPLYGRSRHGECRHGVPRDHQAGVTETEHFTNVPVWRCSDCGAEDIWREGWRYFGTFECKKCGLPEVERVECPVCAARKPAEAIG